MRSRILLLSLFTVAFFLSGCYTQLQYSQRLNRITDERPSTPGYSWDGDDEEEGPVTEADSNYGYGYEDGYREAFSEFPFYYRDYMTANWYARHGFGSPYYYHDPFYDWYYPYSSGFSLNLYFGSPWRISSLAFAYPLEYYAFLSHFRYHRYYPYFPRYSYYPGFYGYHFGPQYYFNPSYFFLQTGYAAYVGTGKDSDRKFGRRTTVGTNRVATSSNRIENNSRNRTSVQKATNGRRTTILRSRGGTSTDRSRTVRSRSSSDSGSRVRATGRSGSRSRSSGNGNLERSGSRDRGGDHGARVNGDTDDQSRTGIRVERVTLLRNRNNMNRAEMQKRLRKNYRAPDIDIDRINRTRFDDRFKRFRYNFYNGISRGTNFDNSRFTPSRTKINSSSSNRTRVRSSSSSSGSSRSRSSSSRSSGSSSKKRSRGGN